MTLSIVGCNRTEQKTIQNADGSVYVGQVINEIPNGKGALTLKDGSKFEGDFKNGKLNGQGSYVGLFSYRAEGQFKDGKLNGKGEIQSQEGITSGNFIDGRLNGDGYFESGSTGDRYIGNFKDGILIGEETIEFANGDKYVGQQINDSMDGNGTLVYAANGTKYIGEFKKNKPTGNGKYFLADGTELQYNEVLVRNQMGIPLNAELNKTQREFVQYFVFMKKKISEIELVYGDISKSVDGLKDGTITVSNEDYKKLESIDLMLKSEYQLINSVYTPFGSTNAKDIIQGSLQLIDKGISNILLGIDMKNPSFIFLGKSQVFVGTSYVFNNDKSRINVNDKLTAEIEYSKKILNQ